MGSSGVLPRALAVRLASTTGLRNRLVHGYEKVEHQIVHRSLKSLIRDYRQYLVKMSDYVQFEKSV